MKTEKNKEKMITDGKSDKIKRITERNTLPGRSNHAHDSAFASDA